MPIESPTLYEVPLPTIVGATHVGDPTKVGSRVSGPPSQKYPILRDLADSPAQITIEVDTESRRFVGVIQSISEGRGLSSPPALYFSDPSPNSVNLTKIIAFRVLKIEAAMGEKGLVL
jgi:hypothetical protein